MSGSDWGNKVALGVAYLALLVIVFGASIGLTIGGYAELQKAYATYQATAENEREAAINKIENMCFDTDRAKFSDCLRAEMGTYYKQQATNQDLQAQQDMAFWAKALFMLGFGQAVISALGILFIWRSLALNRDAVTVATDANKVARKNAMKELRAYMSVMPDGINRLTKRKNMLIGHIVIRNVGSVTAKNVEATVVMKAVVGKDVLGNDFKLLIVPVKNIRKIGSVHPTAEIRMGSPEVVSLDELKKIKKEAGDKIVYIYVYGRVTYTNGFDKTLRFTNFCYRHDTDSQIPSTGKIVIPKEVARYHPYGNEAT